MKKILVTLALLSPVVCGAATFRPLEQNTNNMGLRAERKVHENVDMICIIGTHSTGKTTLVYGLAEQLKRQGRNTIVVEESARKAPTGINARHSVDSTQWIAFHSRCEEIACKSRGYDSLVTDRSVLDSFAYHLANDLPLDAATSAALEFALHQLATQYARVIFLRCGDTLPKDDGVRHIDPAFRLKTDRIFAELVERAKIPAERLEEVNFADLMSGMEIDISGETLELRRVRATRTVEDWK